MEAKDLRQKQENIFDGAKLGDKFRTRNGKLAILTMLLGNNASLCIEVDSNGIDGQVASEQVRYNRNGETYALYFANERNKDLDIIAKVDNTNSPNNSVEDDELEFESVEVTYKRNSERISFEAGNLAKEQNIRIYTSDDGWGVKDAEELTKLINDFKLRCE